MFLYFFISGDWSDWQSASPQACEGSGYSYTDGIKKARKLELIAVVRIAKYVNVIKICPVHECFDPFHSFDSVL